MASFIFYGAYFLWGAAGGLCQNLVKHRRVLYTPVAKWENGKIKGIDLGFLSAMVIGGIVAMATDHSPIVAVSVGFSGATFLEEASKIQKDKTPPFISRFLGD